MDQVLKQKWVAALRSGEYKQGDGLLWSQRNNTYCCLGVFCEIQGFDLKAGGPMGNTPMGTSFLPDATLYGGLELGHQSKLATMNDFGKSFKEIADFIEQNY